MSLSPKNIIKQLIYVVFISLAVPFLLSFLNSLHPLFDSFSHFRIHLLLMILPIMLLLAFFHKLKNMLIYFALIILGTFYLYSINQPFIAQIIDKDKTNPLKHIQFNLNFRNQKMDEVIKYLKQSNADVVTLQEVTEAHQEVLSRTLNDYPYQAYCAFQSVGSVAILSKHPINQEKSACLHYQGLLWSQILVNDNPLNIVSIHAQWPYPYKQPKQIQYIKEIFQHIKPPTLIAGDFNAVSWSHTVKEIEKASNTKGVKGLRWTIDLKGQLPLVSNMKLPIDHVLLSKEFQVEEIFVEKELGSDHLAVVTKMWY